MGHENPQQSFKISDLVVIVYKDDRTWQSLMEGSESTTSAHDWLSHRIRRDQKIKMASFLSGLEVEPATSQQRLRPPTSGLELDPFYSGLELDHNLSGLNPVSVDHGPESTPAECHEQNAPQVVIGTEVKELIDGESPAGLPVQEPNENPPRKKSSHRLVVTLVLVVILIAIVVPVSITQTQNNSRWDLKVCVRNNLHC